MDVKSVAQRRKKLTTLVLLFSFFPSLFTASAQAGQTDCPPGTVAYFTQPDGLGTPPVGGPSTAQGRTTDTRRRVPREPSAPPQLTRKIDVQFFGCHRQFEYRGKLFNADSNNRQDGEKLRPILNEVPAAVAALNAYQRNRRKVRVSAYVGTAGLVLGAAAFIIGGQMTNGTGDLTATGTTVRTVGAISGLGITVASFFYGFGYLKTNEENLSKAVSIYNRSRPDDAIELKFRTELSFEDLVPGS